MHIIVLVPCLGECLSATLSIESLIYESKICSTKFPRRLLPLCTCLWSRGNTVCQGGTADSDRLLGIENEKRWSVYALFKAICILVASSSAQCRSHVLHVQYGPGSHCEIGNIRMIDQVVRNGILATINHGIVVT